VDLQSGPRFVLELDVADLRRHRLAGLREDVRGRCAKAASPAAA